MQRFDRGFEYELIFMVNGWQIRIQQRKPGIYYAFCDSFRREYLDHIDVHMKILKQFLGEMFEDGKIDAETANWPENKITILN